MITTTKLNGNIILRMCPFHPETQQEELERTFEIMNKCADSYHHNQQAHELPS